MAVAMRPVYKLNDIPGFNDLLNDTNVPSNKLLDKIEQVTKANHSYKMIRYDKEMLCDDLIPTHGLLRSVIINSKNKVVSFAPPKAIPSDKFIAIHPQKSEGMIAEEFVEGTMVNLFWDNSEWEISTRNVVGAETIFTHNRKKTFRELFLETAAECNLNFELLNKSCSYSFVLQHPNIRIVMPVLKPELYLVQVYEVVHTDAGIVNIYPIYLPSVATILYNNKVTVKYPQVYYNWNTYSDLINQFGSANTPYHIMGVVIKMTITGERCKIRNPNYEEVRHLKGNQSKLQFQYLSLRKERTVRDYLHHYPEHKKAFSQFRDQLHLFTTTLYTNYISCYIKKNRPLVTFPHQYKTHMFNLHQKYMNELLVKGLYVNNTVVIQYVNDLHATQQMYAINYNMRRRNIERTIMRC